MKQLFHDYQRLAEKHGFVLIRRNRHAIFRHNNGGMLVCPTSPSDSRRGLKQLQRDINRVLAKQSIL